MGEDGIANDESGYSVEKSVGNTERIREKRYLPTAGRKEIRKIMKKLIRSSLIFKNQTQNVFSVDPK